VTYSIVARDPQTGLLGVAVQTAMFAAGASVPWARAGVGAVATQPSAQAVAASGNMVRCLTGSGSQACHPGRRSGHRPGALGRRAGFLLSRMGSPPMTRPRSR